MTAYERKKDEMLRLKNVAKNYLLCGDQERFKEIMDDAIKISSELIELERSLGTWTDGGVGDYPRTKKQSKISHLWRTIRNFYERCL